MKAVRTKAVVPAKITPIETAQGIFARDTNCCLGPKEIMAVYAGHNLELPADLPPIPWSPAELAAARARGEYLMLMPPGLTMQAICEKGNNLGPDGGKLLFDTDWYEKEEFFTKATTGDAWDWHLITRAVIPGSTGQNYVEQTARIRDYLTDVVHHDRDLPPVYQQAVAEFSEKEDTLTELVVSDWQEADRQLSTFALNRLFRPTPAQTLALWVAYLAVNRERLFESLYHWTPVLSSGGGLVDVGGFDRDGARVRDWSPRARRDGLGVVFSRRARVESV